jgi:hypothetical protein
LNTGGPAFFDWNQVGYPYDEDEDGFEEFTEDEQEGWEEWEEWVGPDDEYDDGYYESDFFGDPIMMYP